MRAGIPVRNPLVAKQKYPTGFAQFAVQDTSEDRLDFHCNMTNDELTQYVESDGQMWLKTLAPEPGKTGAGQTARKQP